uniref:hypothetical protein n=1 Tax=Chlorogloeopsis sp. ULAP02 TaxID=3107926 RepID=UPI0031368DEB
MGVGLQRLSGRAIQRCYLTGNVYAVLPLLADCRSIGNTVYRRLADCTQFK